MALPSFRIGPVMLCKVGIIFAFLQEASRNDVQQIILGNGQSASATIAVLITSPPG
jgi:hypothetical protein